MSNFQLLEGTIIKSLGLLSAMSMLPLYNLVQELYNTTLLHTGFMDKWGRWLQNAMTHACDRLRTFPCTFHDAAMQVLRDTGILAHDTCLYHIS